MVLDARTATSTVVEGAIVTGLISWDVFVKLAIEATSKTRVLFSSLKDVIKFDECETLETKNVRVTSLTVKVMRVSPVKDACCLVCSEDIPVALADDVRETRTCEEAEAWFARLGMLADSLTELR